LTFLESNFLLVYRDAHISAVAFHPTRRMAVTSSYGGDFKVFLDKLLLMVSFFLEFGGYSLVYIFQIWRKNEVEQKNQILQNSGWVCHAVGSYKY